MKDLFQNFGYFFCMLLPAAAVSLLFADRQEEGFLKEYLLFPDRQSYDAPDGVICIFRMVHHTGDSLTMIEEDNMQRGGVQ